MWVSPSAFGEGFGGACASAPREGTACGAEGAAAWRLARAEVEQHAARTRAERTGWLRVHPELQLMQSPLGGGFRRPGKGIQSQGYNHGAAGRESGRRKVPPDC